MKPFFDFHFSFFRFSLFVIYRNEFLIARMIKAARRWHKQHHRVDDEGSDHGRVARQRNGPRTAWVGPRFYITRVSLTSKLAGCLCPPILTKHSLTNFATESFMDKPTGQEDFLPWSVLVDVVCDKFFFLLSHNGLNTIGT